jgi:hypothetical protein
LTGSTADAPTTAAVGSASGWTLRWAVRVLQIEAAAIGLLTLVAIWAAVAAANASTSSALATPVFAGIYTATLAGLAVALGRGKALARGLAIVLEMLMLPIGYSMISVGLIWLGVPTLIFGLAGSVLLLAPSTRSALGLN